MFAIKRVTVPQWILLQLQDSTLMFKLMLRKCWNKQSNVSEYIHNSRVTSSHDSARVLAWYIYMMNNILK